MKQNLRFRGGYCPNRTRPIYLLLLVFLLIGIGGKGAFGQFQFAVPDKITPLQIGDTIPEWLWHLPLQVVNHPDGKDTITLGDYRGKLIILDFWATWCQPCLRSLSKLDSVQRALNEGFLVLPIAKEGAEVAANLLRNRGLALPSIIEDKLLAESFPHLTIPHQVWLKGDSVLAITGQAAGTEKNIRSALESNAKISLPVKQDIRFGYFESIERYANRLGATLFQRSMLSGYIPGLQGSRMAKNDTAQVLAFTNYPPLLMYRTLFKTTYNQLHVESRFADRLGPSKAHENRFCFQFLMPAAVPEKEFLAAAETSLGHSLGLKVSLDIREVDCWIITKTDARHIGPVVGDESGYPFETYVELLNYTNAPIPGYPIIVDESGFSGRIPKECNEQHLGLKPDRLRQLLKPLGLTFTVERRPLALYVIKDDEIAFESPLASINQ